MQAQGFIDATTFTELKEMMGADFIVELIDTYNAETGDLIEKLRMALANGDPAAFGRHAHSIKSSSASLGALSLSQQARELEMMGKANDLSGADLKLEHLVADFLHVKERLEELRDEP